MATWLDGTSFSEILATCKPAVMLKRQLRVSMSEGRVDNERVDEFMHADYSSILGSLTLVCGEVQVAEEAVQEALLRAWTCSEAGERIESLPAWIRVVALNLTRDHLRRSSREARALTRLATELERASEFDAPNEDISMSDVVRSLALLSRRQREVTVLHYREGLSVSEVGRELGMADGTVKVQLHRARIALAKQLRRHTDAPAIALPAHWRKAT